MSEVTQKKPENFSLQEKDDIRMVVRGAYFGSSCTNNWTCIQINHHKYIHTLRTVNIIISIIIKNRKKYTKTKNCNAMLVKKWMKTDGLSLRPKGRDLILKQNIQIQSISISTCKANK